MESWAEDDGTGDLGVPPEISGEMQHFHAEVKTVVETKLPTEEPEMTIAASTANRPKIVMMKSSRTIRSSHTTSDFRGVPMSSRVSHTTLDQSLSVSTSYTATRFAVEQTDHKSHSFHRTPKCYGARVDQDEANGRRFYKRDTTHVCKLCKAIGAVFELATEHIDEIRTCVNSGEFTLDEDTKSKVDNLVEGFYCTDCLEIVSPRCVKCKKEPRRVIPPGKRYPFAMFCKNCMTEYNRNREASES